jgi:hypothetical protein
MTSQLIKTVLFAGLSGMLFAQEAAQSPAIGYKDSQQVDYLDITGTVFFTNAGFHSVVPFPVIASDICVNAYVFTPITNVPDGALGAQLTSCCACRVGPNATGSFTPSISGPVIVKLVSTLPARPGAACDATLIPSKNLGAPAGYASGMRAWSVSQPTVLSEQLSTSLFRKIPLGDTEQAKLAQLCTGSANRCTCQ